jgi:esterase/lipase
VTTGILLLHGSSGKPDLDRVRILEAEGYDVVVPRADLLRVLTD